MEPLFYTNTKPNAYAQLNKAIGLFYSPPKDNDLTFITLVQNSKYPLKRGHT